MLSSKLLDFDKSDIYSISSYNIIYEVLDFIKNFLTLNTIKIIGQFEGASRAHHS